MTKHLIPAILFITLAVSAYAQQVQQEKQKFFFKDRFISSGGLFFGQPIKFPSVNNYAGISFSPQLNLLNSFTDYSIAFGSDIDLGHRINKPDTSKFMVSIPAIITINVGHLATKDFYGSWGVFVGGGMEYCYINGDSQSGVMWTAGLRMWLFKKSFTLRYSQLIFDEANTMRIFSLQLNLGSYLEKVYRNNQLSRFVKPLG